MVDMKKTFEASLGELEAVVRQLENGDLPLEESLKLFEDGVKLSRECRERLASAERRIEVLMKDNDGNMVLSDLDETSPKSGRAENVKRIVFDGGED
jgi:exodeoxyribonuclease VII small subunit